MTTVAWLYRPRNGWLRALPLLLFGLLAAAAVGPADAASGVQTGMYGYGNRLNALVGKDASGNLSLGVTLFDQNGVPLGGSNLFSTLPNVGVTLTQTTVPLSAGLDAVIAAASPGRRYLCVYNVGAGLANLGAGAPAVPGQGVPFSPSPDPGTLLGGGFCWEGAGVPTNDIHAISGLGTTLVVLQGS